MKNTSTYDITYHVTGENLDWQYCITLDEDSKLATNPPPEKRPFWTELEFNKCSHCPLSSSEHSHCPLALNLSDLIARTTSLVSYEKVHANVTTPDRAFKKDTTAQRAVSSIMGLIMASSGCPHTEIFRPMARFHLPFSNEAETLFRAASTYLLVQYFRRQDGEPSELSLDGLKGIYENVVQMNAELAQRISHSIEQDASINALVCLDILAQFTTFGLDDSLADLRPFFENILRDNPPPKCSTAAESDELEAVLD